MPQIIISSLADSSLNQYAVVNCGSNLLDEIENLSPDCFGGLSHDIHLNGSLLCSIDHDTDGCEIDSILDFELSKYDRVDICIRPAGLTPIEWAVIAISALSLVVSLTFRPDAPGNTGGGQSPNNKLNAATNEFRPNEAVPQIFGSPTAYPDFIQPSYYVYENNIKIFRELFCVGEGRYQIDKVKSGETNFDEIPSSKYTIYNPGETPPQNERLIVRSTSQSKGQGNIPLAPPDDKSTSFNGEYEGMYAVGNDSVLELKQPNNIIYDANLKAGDYLDCYLTVQAQIPTDILIGVYEVIAVDDASTPKTITLKDTGGASTIGTPGYFSGRITTVGPGGTPLNWVGWFTIPGDKNTGVFFNLSMPQGIRGEDGERIGVGIEMQIEQIDSSGNPIPGGHYDSITFGFEGSTMDQQYQTVDFGVIPEGIYRGRARRLNNEHANAADRCDLENINGIELQSTPDYGDVTLLYTERRADPLSADAGSSKINVELTRMLPSWGDDKLRPSRSFADAIYWLYCVKAGYAESSIDLQSLYDIERSLSDERLGYFDYTFDDKDMGLSERINIITNVARCVWFKSYQKISFNRIERKPYHSDAYTRRDVNGAARTTMQARIPTDRDSVSLTYVTQPDNVEKTIYRSIYNGQIVDTEGLNPDEFKLLGCQDELQAENRIEYEIRRILYTNRTADVPILYNGLNSQKGDRVRWADIYDFGAVDGEILGTGGNGVYYTSEEFNPENGKTYYVQITDQDGVPGAQLECKSVPGNKKAFQAAGASGVYIADRDIIQLGSRYVIAAEEDIEWSDWTLVSTTQEGDSKTVMLGLENYTEKLFEKD